MRILALNGLGTPIARDFPPSLLESGQVVCPFKANWTGSQREREWIMDQIQGDYVLAGFSDGCLPAYRIACIDERCKALVIHSGLWSLDTLRDDDTMPRIPLYFFTTKGDKTPTIKQTITACLWFAAWGYDCKIQELPPTSPWWRPAAWWLRHEFRNCVPALLEIQKNLSAVVLPAV